MFESCRLAVEAGLAGIAFTEHADLTDWLLPEGMSIRPGWERYLNDGTLRLPQLDVENYLASIEECRAQFPQLAILSGVEISEPHWHGDEVAALLAGGRFDRVLSSVHAGKMPGGACEISVLFRQHPAVEVISEYLAEIVRLVETFEVQVLAHIDYAVRYWPRAAGAYDPREFEADYRRALTALAKIDAALEINTRLPLDPLIVHWWVESGGCAITLGSDSHDPATVGHGLAEAAKLARSFGFEPSTDPRSPWRGPSR
jgi:histidinol-phosphatase (PHP family)